MVVAVRLDDGGEAGPEAVHVAVGAEGFLCARLDAVPAEASSDGLQRGPRPEIVQDPRCEELAATPGPGEVVLPRHSEVAAGNGVLAGELRFDAEQRCFYVLADVDPIGDVWPAGFKGRVDPPRLTAEAGATVVALGDRFEVRGRFASGVADGCGPVEAQSNGFIASGDIDLTRG